MSLSTNVSLREVFDEFERIKNNIRIIARPELARDTAQFPTKELAVYPQKGYANDQSEIKVPLNLLQKAENNLKAENIKEGINIFGLDGTMLEATKKRKTRLYATGLDTNSNLNGIELDFQTGSILSYARISNDSRSIWTISMNPKFVIHQNVNKRINVLDSNFKLLRENLYTYPWEGIFIFSTIIDKGKDRVFAPNLYSGNYYSFNEFNPTNYAIIDNIQIKDTNIYAKKIVGKEVNGRLRLFVLDGTTFKKSIHEINPDTYATINKRELHIETNDPDIEVFLDPVDGKLKIYVICMSEIFVYDADTLQQTKKLVSRDTFDFKRICIGYEEELTYNGTVYIAK